MPTLFSKLCNSLKRKSYKVNPIKGFCMYDSCFVCFLHENIFSSKSVEREAMGDKN